MLNTLRRWLVAANAARLQLDPVRLRVIKIGGWVRESTRFTIPDIWVHFSFSTPAAPPGSCSPAPLASTPEVGE